MTPQVILSDFLSIKPLVEALKQGHVENGLTISFAFLLVPADGHENLERQRGQVQLSLLAIREPVFCQRRDLDVESAAVRCLMAQLHGQVLQTLYFVPVYYAHDVQRLAELY